MPTTAGIARTSVKKNIPLMVQNTQLITSLGKSIPTLVVFKYDTIAMVQVHKKTPINPSSPLVLRVRTLDTRFVQVVQFIGGHCKLRRYIGII